MIISKVAGISLFIALPDEAFPVALATDKKLCLVQAFNKNS